MPGYFITFEGIDGSGKTTQLNAIKDLLVKEGEDVLVVKEPGDIVNGVYIGSEIGGQIRHMLFKDPTTNVLDKEVTDLLFLADHVQLWKKTITPALAAGRVILCDRYADSQFAYGIAKGSSDRIMRLYKDFYGPTPNTTILLVGDPVFLESRTKRTGTNEEGKQDGKRWAGIEHQKIVREAYVRQLTPDPRTITVDVTEGKSIAAVTKEIWEQLQPRLAKAMADPATQSEMFTGA